MNHSGRALANVFCPICGLLGQLKADHRWPSTQYSVDHYKNKKGKLITRLSSHLHQRYAYRCYLGTQIVLQYRYFDYPFKTLFAYARSLRIWL